MGKDSYGNVKVPISKIKVFELNLIFYRVGMPVDMSEDEFESICGETLGFLQDETDRSGHRQPDRKKRKKESSLMSDGDLVCLRKK